jgi:hypothetical protein
MKEITATLAQTKFQVFWIKVAQTHASQGFQRFLSLSLNNFTASLIEYGF